MITSIRPLAPKPFSIWLDCFRWASAWVVLISHVGGILLIPLSRLPEEFHSMPQIGFSFVAGLSHYAVMIFFVMSGYLVGGSYIGSSAEKRQPLHDYATKRLVRLTVVVLPTIALTAALAFTVWLLWGDEAVAGFGDRRSSLSADVAACNLLYMQDVLCRQYGGNLSLWSLTHEFWYYVCFPMIAAPFLRNPSYREIIQAAVAIIILISLSLAQFHPVSIGIYFGVWVLGVAAAISQPLYSMSKIPTLFIVGAFLIITSLVRVARTALEGVFVQDILFDSLVATSFTVVLLVLKSKSDLKPPPLPRLHNHLAKFSFSLYCVHYPIAVTFGSFGVHVLGFTTQPSIVDLTRWAYVITGLTVCLICAYLMYLSTEKHTDFVRSFLTRRFLTIRT